MTKHMGRDYKHTYYSNNQLPENIMDPEKGLASFGYDGLNRLQTETRYIAYGGLTKKAGTTYKYDDNGNLEKIIDAKGNITRYEYDNKDRLTDIYYPGTALTLTWQFSKLELPNS